MKRLLPVLSVLVILTTLFPAPKSVTAAPPTSRPAFGGDVVCLPQAYVQQPADCLPVGPSPHLSELARVGITIPPQPFPVIRIPAELAGVQYMYMRVYAHRPVSTYASLDDAMVNNVSRSIPAGKMIYLSYSKRVENSSGVYYLIQTGEWVSGDSVETRVSPSTVFRGVQITRPLHASFGWVLDITESRQAPGFSSPTTGKKYGRFDMVWAYSIKTVDNVDWVQVGDNEWLEDRVVDRVTPNPTPPAGVTTGRWIEVNLAEQTLLVYDHSQLIFATLVTSGSKPFYTRPGTFQIYKKLDVEQMSGTFEADHSDYYYLENVPWTMYFDEARALHGVYWHTLFGYVASHGCVNLSIADAKWLYDWAKLGDTVYVWDPTGKTPTDIPSAGGP
ncbi:MAG TPA: L,D-transpeptidase [Anaerolineaceae bacterium]|nr:L,D-transpeptidase [Anaerolineaceae bacterium]